MTGGRKTRISRLYCKYLIAIVICLVLLIKCPGILLARRTTPAQAERVVEGWLKIDPKPLGSALGRQVEKVDTFNNEDSKPIYYVVYLRPSGFVIVPADDLVEPIICFLSDGIYDPSPDNCLGALVSRDLPARVANARDLDAKIASSAKEELTEHQIALQTASARAKSKWDKFQDLADELNDPNVKTSLPTVSDIRVAPLVQSKWSQGSVCNNLTCYNYYTYNHYVCGCVATAMAQIMRFHQYPTEGIGVDSYTIYVNGSSTTAYTRGGDGSGGPYNWSQMVLVPNSVCSSLTLTQRQAIGALCYDAGVTVEMNYTSMGSMAYSYKARDAFIDPFLYSNAIYAYNEWDPMPEASLNTMINTNLDATYPVYLGIYDTVEGAGHAIVCDGYGYNYSTLYHHLNLGWGGYDDAWYDLPDIDASGHPFNVVDECIYNIYTSGSGEIISGRVTDMSSVPLSGAVVTAVRTGGGTYNATTNAKGIYALTKVPSASTYNVSVTRPGYAFTSQQVTTGTSSNDSSSSGNRWAINFVGTPSGPMPPVAQSDTVSVEMGVPITIELQAIDDGEPDPPAALTYIIVSLPAYGTLEDPATGRIDVEDLPYTLTAYGNQVIHTPNLCYGESYGFDFKADDGGTPPDGGESSIATITIDVQPPGPTKILEADFDTGLPPGWTIINGGTSNDTWEPANPEDWTDRAYWSGIITTPFMVVDSDTAGDEDMDEQLITPIIDCSAYEGVTLKVTHQFVYYSGWEYGDIDIRINGGSWQNLRRYNDADVSENLELNISSYADGQSNVQIRWHYYDAWWDYYWGIDDVEVSGVGEAVGTGNLDSDCDVDMADFAVLAAAWLSSPGDGNWNPDCDISDPPDDFIDELDLSVLIGNWLLGAQ